MTKFEIHVNGVSMSCCITATRATRTPPMLHENDSTMHSINTLSSLATTATCRLHRRQFTGSARGCLSSFGLNIERCPADSWQNLGAEQGFDCGVRHRQGRSTHGMSRSA